MPVIYPSQKVPRILILSGVRGDTRRYRSFHPYEQLQLAGIDCLLSHTTDPALFEKARQASIFILHRTTYDANLAHLIGLARQQNALIILDVDDLTFDVSAFDWIDSPDFQDPIRAALYKEDLRRNRQTLDLCDSVFASTQTLSEQVSRLGKPAWVHRNAFSLEMLAFSEQAHRLSKRNTDRVTIGYASGTPTHNRDFRLIKPVLREILAEFPQTELRILGRLDPGDDWGSLSERVSYEKLVPWRQLPFGLAQFDINIAPLVADNPFSQSKSEIKYVEAALVRVPTIASRTRAFEDAIRPEDNGFLAAQDGDWSTALSRLVTDRELRVMVGQRAYADVIKHYHPVQRAKDLIETLDQASTRVFSVPLWSPTERSRFQENLDRNNLLAENYWSSLNEEGEPTLFRMGLYALHNRGFQTLLKQIWIFIRRGISPIFPYRLSHS